MSNIAIIICTLDRPTSLRNTLESLAHCFIPEGCKAEVLVVDNGPSEETERVVKQAPSGPLVVRYLKEPQRGQAKARNRGIRSTGADIILWTDDDVVLPPDWLIRMAEPLIAGEGDAVMGGIRLGDEERRKTLTVMQRNWLAESEGAILPIGANMGFNRRVVDTVGMFDEALGPGALGFRDDTDYGARIVKSEFRLKNLQDCVVLHFPDERRFTRDGLLQAAVSHGRSTFYGAEWVRLRHRLFAWPFSFWNYMRFVKALVTRPKDAEVTDAELLAIKFAVAWRQIATGRYRRSRGVR